MNKIDLIYGYESGIILDSAQYVQNTLGSGFLERVYENALLICLEEKGLTVKQQFPIKVYFKDKVVGDYTGDLLVNEKVIIEIKSVNELAPVHKAQIINYLKATGIKLGILINFGKTKLQFKRFVNQKGSRNNSYLK